MNTLQWNIFFIGGPTEDGTSSKEANIIVKSIGKFREDVKNEPFNENIKINLLQINSHQKNGNAELFSIDYPNKKNEFIPQAPPIDFNCLEVGDYVTLLKNWITPTKGLENQKYVFIFLAHSFGGGFFNTEDKNVEGGVKYFTTIQLNEAIERSFVNDTEAATPKKIMVDCFLALNCGLQSIETNLAFSNNVHYLIGSQQPLDPSTISYKELLQSMAFDLYLGDQIIFLKFLYDSYRNYKTFVQKRVLEEITHDEDKNYVFSIDEFSLCITVPANAINLKDKLNDFAQAIKPNKLDKFLQKTNKNIETMVAVAATCKDPSGLGLVNIIDAYQFYATLQSTYYMGKKNTEKIIYKTLEGILEAIRSVIILNLNSGNLCKTEPLQGDVTGLYLPMGLGHLMPKNKSDTITKLLKIFGTIYNTSESGEPTEPNFGSIPKLVEEITVLDPKNPGKT